MVPIFQRTLHHFFPLGELKSPFYNVVWLFGHIPRYSVSTWLAILNRLTTADRLVLIAINSSPCCSLCNYSESHDHLFFNCPYSMQIWEYISLKICVSWTPQSRSGWISTLSGLLGKSLRTTIIKLTFPTTVYHVWLERNCRKFQNVSCPANVVESRIFTVVILRLLSLSNLPKGSHSSPLVSIRGLVNAIELLVLPLCTNVFFIVYH